VPHRPDPAQDAEARSVDPREVARYAALARTWWDRSGPFWPLHRLNALRVTWIRDRLCAHFGRDPNATRPLAALEVLDVGCGGGILSESIAALGARVLGIDVVARNVAIAEDHAAHTGVRSRYRVASAEALAVAGERFDAVLNMEVVEHVADLPGFMDACCDLVRPGGAMVVATLNRTLRSFLFAIVGAEYVLRWLPRGTHQWRRFPTPAEMSALLAAGQLGVTASTGVWVNPLTRRFGLTRSLAVNYMLMATRPTSGDGESGRAR
jgi:2-polyprenyl-6-hydroxyphenyl methylase/3-demethylubiquinone-9 3-methyltransferase